MLPIRDTLLNTFTMTHCARWITALLMAFCLSSAWAQRVYDSQGRQTGRVDAERFYNASGQAIGRLDGQRVYDASGRQLGRTDGLRRMQTIVFFYFFM